MVSCRKKGLDSASSPMEPGPRFSSRRPRPRGPGTCSPGSEHLALGGPAADSNDLFHQLLLLEPHGLLHGDLTEGVHGVLHSIRDHTRLVRLYPDLPSHKGKGQGQGQGKQARRQGLDGDNGHPEGAGPCPGSHSSGDTADENSQVGTGSCSQGLTQTSVEHLGHRTCSSDSVLAAPGAQDNVSLIFVCHKPQCEIHFIILPSPLQIHDTYSGIDRNATAMRGSVNKTSPYFVHRTLTFSALP